MHVLCDFAMFWLSFITLLDQFGLPTNSVHPVASSLFSAVFVFQVFRLIKVPKKFRKNYIKNQRAGSFRNNQGREPGPPPGSQKGPWRGPNPRARQAPSWLPWVAPRRPLRLYNPLGVETPKQELFFAETSLFRRRRRFQIRVAWRSCPGTLPEGDHPSGRPSIAMDASRMCRE